jgi:ribosomal protein S17E
MGKTKSKLIRRSANTLIKEGISFEGNFERNKKILGKTMPSKKLRNKMAGFLVRAKKEEKKKEEMLKN